MYTAMNMTDHRQCVALSGCFRGKLCDQLMHRPGRSVGKGELVYGLGDSAQSVFFLRRGFVKLTSLTEDGRELILRPASSRRGVRRALPLYRGAP
jgi:CRP/FNR family cyclic AMP-dependent transcriptional regulator